MQTFNGKLLLVLVVLFMAMLACLGGSDIPTTEPVDTNATAAALQATQTAIEGEQQQQPPSSTPPPSPTPLPPPTSTPTIIPTVEPSEIIGTWRLAFVPSGTPSEACSNVIVTFGLDGIVRSTSGELESISSYTIRTVGEQLEVTQTFISDNDKPNCQGIPAAEVREDTPSVSYVDFLPDGSSMFLYLKPEGEVFLVYERVE